jgi:hypothetical protein
MFIAAAEALFAVPAQAEALMLFAVRQIGPPLPALIQAWGMPLFAQRRRSNRHSCRGAHSTGG